MNAIKSFILTNLNEIHSGILSSRIKGTFELSFAFSPLMFIPSFLLEWKILNETYLMFVLGAIIVDHIIGTFLHVFKLRDGSLKKNIVGLITKLGLVVAVQFLFEGLQHIVSEQTIIQAYLKSVLNLTIFMYPAGSAFMNTHVLTNGSFPPIGIINKIKSYQDTGELKDTKK